MTKSKQRSTKRSFEEWFLYLKKFHKAHGHCRPPSKLTISADDGKLIEVVNIGKWITNIRHAYRIYQETGETKGEYWLQEHEIKQLKVGLEILFVI